MATTEKSEVKLDRKPPYIPWKTLDNYIGSLKGSTVPHTLDGSIKPRGMAGGMWRQLLSALRFLGLTKDGNVVDDSLESLVASHGTDQWSAAVKEVVLPAYDEIIGNLPLENATPAQLNKCFSDFGAGGQVLEKCVRFYLHALKLSGVKYSSHLSMREPGSAPKKTGASKRKPKIAKKEDAENPATPNSTAHSGSGARLESFTPPGMIDFQIPIGEVNGLIRVPRSINLDQYPIVEAMLNAVKTLAAQNSPKQK